MSQLWINGTLVDKADARVSPFDHGFLYGDGVWEHFRLFSGKPFAAEQHFRILFNSAKALGIDIPLSQSELLAAIDTTAKANNRTEGYVRVVVTRGLGTIGPDPRKIEPQVIVITEEYQPFPQELYGHGLHAVVSPFQLDSKNPVHRYRTLNQLHIVHAKQYSLQHGCLEVLLSNQSGEMIGATEGSLFIAKAGAVVDASGQCEDATRFVVASLAGSSERSVALADLLAADEAFIAGTACGVIGIIRIDGTDIGSGSEGPITREIRQQFERLTRGKSA